MNKVEVIATSPTGSGKYKAFLHIQSGVIEYHTPGEGVEYSHISSEASLGWSIVGTEIEPLPAEEKKAEASKPVIVEAPVELEAAPEVKEDASVDSEETVMFEAPRKKRKLGNRSVD